MSKDPAFLFYSKDWITGTAGMMPEEKGVYIDFLAYQHQNGHLPIEPERLARIAGISQTQFNKIWATLKHHFKQEENKTFNEKLNGVMIDRKNKGHRNKISGTFASVIRLANLNKKEYQSIRSSFKIDDWLDTDTDMLTERLTEWLSFRLESIANANADENNCLLIEGSVRETPTEKNERLRLDWDKRKNKFYDELKPHIEQYGYDMIKAFYSYWSEPDKNYKMKYEKQDTWEVERRLVTWAGNNSRFKK